jgi:tetratricopeptide (TPR) repeat protein
MSTHRRISSLLLLSGLIVVQSPLNAQKIAPPSEVVIDVRHQSPEWLTIQPHLPDPAVTSAAQLETVGDVLRARRFPEEAMKYYVYALQRGGNQATLMNKLGVTELDLRHIAAARAYFQQVVRIQRKDALGWNNLGAVEYLDGHYGGAISDYRKAIKYDKRSATFHSNLGTAYFEEKDFDKARNEFDVALKIDPEMMEHHGSTGISAHMLSPADHAHFCFEIARLYAHRGDEEQMLHYLQLASEGGFDILGTMRDDSVMAPYRKDPRVITLVQNARAIRNGRISVADAQNGVPPLPAETHD